LKNNFIKNLIFAKEQKGKKIRFYEFLFTCLLIFFSLFPLSFSLYPSVFAAENNAPAMPSQIGQVLSVETFGEATPSRTDELKQTKQNVEIKILTGAHKGEKIITDNVLTGNPAYDINLKKNEKVILHVEQNKGGINYFVEDKYRVGGLYLLTGLFVLLLLAIGGKKGFFSLVSILTTLGLIFWVLTPLILNGFNPVCATVLVCLLASIIAIYLVGGINAKSSGAILGTALSLTFAALLSILSIKLVNLNGFASEQYMYLASAHADLNLLEILASAMIIGSLGAVMDIGMSISSTINELSSNSEMGIKDLFFSGMNVGKDIIGMMSNTLILAYIGGSLALILLSNSIDLQKFFNLNQVAVEISSALIGSIGIVLCVPITAIISAVLIKRFSRPTLAENDFDDII
jgi:uncharacterized membrane protein